MEDGQHRSPNHPVHVYSNQSNLLSQLLLIQRVNLLSIPVPARIRGLIGKLIPKLLILWVHGTQFAGRDNAVLTTYDRS